MSRLFTSLFVVALLTGLLFPVMTPVGQRAAAQGNCDNITQYSVFGSSISVDRSDVLSGLLGTYNGGNITSTINAHLGDGVRADGNFNGTSTGPFSTTGDIITNGNFSYTDNNIPTIGGNVIAGGTITDTHNTIPAAKKFPNTTPAPYTPPTLPAPIADFTSLPGPDVPGTADHDLAPGTYGDVHVGAHTLTLHSGTYIMNYLSTGNGGKINIDLSTAPNQIKIFIKGQLDLFNNGANINLTGGGSAADVYWEVHGTGNNGGGNGLRFIGTLYAPYGAIKMSNDNSHVDGALYAGQSVTFGNSTTVNFVPLAAWQTACDFSASPNPVCVGSPVQFTDQSTGSPTSWNWSFGDGDTSTQQNPTHTYSSPGTYSVSLAISNNSGCSDNETKSSYITINPTPTATASSNSPVYEGTTINLYGGPNGMTSYSWTGPNGFTSSLQNPTITNASTAMAGTYYLSVNNGSCSSDNTTTYVNLIEQQCTISGHKYRCDNSDNCTQEGLENWTITLDGPVSGSTTTDANGYYQFTNLPDGTYTVSEVLEPNWEACTPTSYQIALQGCEGQGVVVSDTNTLVTAGNVTGNAVLAWEPGPNYPNDGPDDSTWAANSFWDQNVNYNFSSLGADWIWENYRVVHPEAGDVVTFQRNFYIPGNPTGGTLNITCDNGYEVYLNGNLVGSAQLSPGWGPAHLTQTYVDTNGWQSVESYPGLTLLQGNNLLEIKTANEYMGPDDSQNDGTASSNPAGLIYELLYQYDVSQVNFCNRPLSGSITIVKDAVPDDPQDFSFTGDLGTFTLDDDNDATLPNTITFSDLLPKTYSVTESLPSGWELGITSASSTNNTTANIDLGPGDNVTVTFTNTKLGSVSGYKWADCNENGQWDQDEVGLIGWEIKLSEKKGDNWVLHSSTTTGPDGAYEFTNLQAGEYKVEETIQSGWEQTYPNTTPHEFTLQAGESKTDVNFGNHSNGGSICANEVMAFSQGTKNDGGPITDPDRTDPTQALGPPDSMAQKLPSFVSLGYDGELILGFAHPIIGSITVHEATWENQRPNCYGPETVDVYGTDDYQDGSTTWTYIGQATNNCGYDGNTHPTTLPLTTPIKYVKLVDTTDKSTNSDDAFDVDAVCGEYACGCIVSGHKYRCDTTDNCTGEGLEGWTITLEDGQGAVQTITANDGSYQFTGLSDGTYTISETPQDGWTNCTPTSYQLTISDNCQIHGQDVIVSDTNTMVTQGNGATPHNAVLAWEPNSNTDPSYWDNSLTGHTFSTAADWIWESYRVVHPMAGDVLTFQRNFYIPGNPTGGTLNITCDNGYEVYLNGNLVGSAQLNPGWGPGHLTQTYVDTNGWQSVESYPGLTLLQGNNLLEIKTANEYMGPDDGQNDGTVDNNPAGLIYELFYEFDATEIDFCNREAIPDISIIKTADPTSTPSGGQVTYTYQVTNTGDVNLSSITLTDDQGLTLTLTNKGDGDNILSPGETWVYQATASLTERTTNTGTACGTAWQDDPELKKEVCNSDNTTVEILEPQGSISGHKYRCDDTDNCTQEGLGDWTINLTGPVSGNSATADTTGYYEFTSLPDGTYTVSEELKPGWEACTPTSYEINLKDGNGYGEVVSDATTEYWDWGTDNTWGTADDGWMPAVACYVHPNWPLSPSGATWIWKTNQVDPATEYNTLPPEGYRTFRKTFEIPHFATITSASIEINADNAYEVYINGVPVGSDGNLSKDGPVESGWQNVETFNCTGELSPGTNTIEIYAVNYFNTGDYKSNPAGVIYKLSYQYETNQVNFCNRQLIPEISIIKTASDNGTCPGSDPLSASIGDNVTYCYTIENTGNVTLSNISVSDDNGTANPGDDFTTNVPGTLDPGASTTVTASQTRTITEDDLPGPIVNTATASAKDPQDNDATNTDNCTVNISTNPGITITKTTDRSCALVGDNVTYTIAIVNTGDVTLLQDSITDQFTGEAEQDISSNFLGTLPVGASDNWSFTRTVLPNDPDPLVNTATAHYHVDGLLNDVSASASASACLGTHFQPDNVIQTSGDNIYNTSGSGQTATQSVLNGNTATYIITIQNDGSATDNFTVFGTAGGAGWTVNYFDAAAGGNNITDNITSHSTWITPNLNPGDSIQIRVEVTPSGLPNGSTKDIFVTSTSDTCACKQDTVKATTTVTSRGGGGGGGGGGAISSATATCPLTLTVHMLGATTTAKMTFNGVLCEDCLASDPTGQNRWEATEGTQLLCANNRVPEFIELTLGSSPPPPSNAAIVGPIYELNAYTSKFNQSPLTISPEATLALAYNPSNQPQNTSALTIAYYDENAGQWVPLETAGYVAGGAEVPNVLATHVNHLTYFAVLAELKGAAPAKFEASNLAISPSQAELNQEVNISVNVANTGGTTESYSLELDVNGILQSAKQVTVAAGTSQTVNFTVTGDTVGKHQVEIAGLSGEFVVAEPQSAINWWLIGGITGAILLIIIIIGLMVRRRQLRGY
jgi:uncharacterized repeat protein (TIGR01451 family)